jgi:hypothetical protein
MLEFINRLSTMYYLVVIVLTNQLESTKKLEVLYTLSKIRRSKGH